MWKISEKYFQKPDLLEVNTTYTPFLFQGIKHCSEMSHFQKCSVWKVINIWIFQGNTSILFIRPLKISLHLLIIYFKTLTFLVTKFSWVHAHWKKKISSLCTLYNKGTLQLLFIFNLPVLNIFSYNTIFDLPTIEQFLIQHVCLKSWHTWLAASVFRSSSGSMPTLWKKPKTKPKTYGNDLMYIRGLWG